MKELIEKAWATPSICWNEISSMIDEAEDEETKERLKYIRTFKRLQEEYETFKNN